MRVVLSITGSKHCRIVSKLSRPLKTGAAKTARHCRVHHGLRDISGIKLVNHFGFSLALGNISKRIVVAGHRAQHIAVDTAVFQKPRWIPLIGDAIDIAGT